LSGALLLSFSPNGYLLILAVSIPFWNIEISLYGEAAPTTFPGEASIIMFLPPSALISLTITTLFFIIAVCY
jgi:hypothetical protein